MPAEYSRLVGDDVYLAGLIEKAPPPSAAATPTATSSEKDEWEKIQQLAADGKDEEALRAIVNMADAGPVPDQMIPVVTVALEGIKNDLKNASAPSGEVERAVSVCDLALVALGKGASPDSAKALELSSKAFNRKGDALLILNQPAEALEAFSRAAELGPDDPYVIYNRGRAHLALGQKEQAREDFTAAASEKYRSPGARKLALEALKQLQ